jgi:hypothetical protein
MMGLESEIERLFHEAQDWDMEMVASSALPTHHTYTTGPRSFSLLQAKVDAQKGGKGGHLRLSLDEGYFLVDRLVLYLVTNEGAGKIGEERIKSLIKIHGKRQYTQHLDKVSASLVPTPGRKVSVQAREHAREDALERLKGEGQNDPITIKLVEKMPGEALKVIVITFDNYDYILESQRGKANELAREDKLHMPPPGFSARWPREIEIREEQGKPGNVYVRSDLWKKTGRSPKRPGKASKK